MASSTPRYRRSRWRNRVIGISLVLLTALSAVALSPVVVAETAATPSSVLSSQGNGDETPNASASIVAVAPNPASDGDAGEFVAVRLPRKGNWSLSDGETTVSIRNESGVVVLTSDPDLVGRTLDEGPRTVVPANATVRYAPLSLANGGERLTLSRGGEVVHLVEFGTASEAERYLPATGEWRASGFAPRRAVSTGPANATAFVLPDAPGVPLSTLEAAEERILLAGYTFASPRVADALAAAVQRSVSVRVLVEANPVGGAARQQARLLDSLAAAGVDVRVVGTSPARFAFHHPKYAVVDDRALVMTENWKPAGTGGKSSRGWGVRVDSEATAIELAEVFAHDVEGPDTRTWSAYRRGRRYEAHAVANGSYPTRFDPRPVRATNVTVLTAPGNAESAIVDRIDAAESRVDVVQPTLGARENALVRATLRAARRGVEVRILLSGGWYVAEENAALVAWLNDWADRTDAPLTAKVAEPKDRYEKIHAKGVLVDDDVVIVGSLNWNRNSARENREVALALAGPEPVAYYREVFEADWRGGDETHRRGIYAAGALAAVAVAGLVARRTVSFARVLE